MSGLSLPISRTWLTASAAALLCIATLRVATDHTLAWGRDGLDWFDSGSVSSGLRYQIVAQAVELDCVAGNLSGVTHDPTNERWFAVTNAPEQIIEFDLQGRCLRQHALPNTDDTEGLVWVDTNRFLVIEEDAYRISMVTLPADPRLEPDIEPIIQLSLLLGKNNRGLEGISYVPDTDTILLAREKSPAAVYAISGLVSGAAMLQIDQQDHLVPPSLLPQDISGMHVSASDGGIYVLSDEGFRLSRLSALGELVETISLRRGDSGLTGSVPQAEGVALDGRGNLVIASEPNLLYVFRRGPG